MKLMLLPTFAFTENGEYQQSADLIHVIDMMSHEATELRIPGLHIAVLFEEYSRPQLTTCLATDTRRRWSKPVSAWALDPTMSSVRTTIAKPEWAEFIERVQFDVIEPTVVEKAA